MKIKVNELKAGQIIRVEFGDYDNWVHFIVDKVEPEGSRINIYCSKGLLHMNFSYLPDDLVEVVE